MAPMHDPSVLVGCEARLIRAGEWARCRLAEITPRGALLELDVPVAVGEKVVACIGALGALAGTVSEAADGRCAVSFSGGGPLTHEHMPECYARA